jgi:hypothetical protein
MKRRWMGRPAGIGYHWAVLAVALTAPALYAVDPARLCWLGLLAALSYGLAVLVLTAPPRQGGPALCVRGQGPQGFSRRCLQP